MINQQAQYATDILHQYANENGIHARDTSDLSPLEQWLIFRLFDSRCTECNGTGRWKDDESDPEIECPKCKQEQMQALRQPDVSGSLSCSCENQKLGQIKCDNTCVDSGEYD